MSIFKTNTTKDYSKSTPVSRVYGSEKKPGKLIIKKQLEDNIIKNLRNLFNSLLFRHQIRLETLIKGSGFICDCVNLLYYKLHKINLNRGGSYINSPDMVKNKKPTINPINK